LDFPSFLLLYGSISGLGARSAQGSSGLWVPTESGMWLQVMTAVSPECGVIECCNTVLAMGDSCSVYDYLETE
jgi:hypothetical protein